MTKQEEIKEGIADILEVWMTRDLALETARTIMAKESYQGVVIKVERELPDTHTLLGNHVHATQAQYDMLKAGYVATESLIKER